MVEYKIFLGLDKHDCRIVIYHGRNSYLYDVIFNTAHSK